MSSEWDEYTQQPLKTEAEKFAEFLDVWDQTVGCEWCGQAWWAENATPHMADFHAGDCPLKGRLDVHAIWGGSSEEVWAEPVYHLDENGKVVYNR